MHICRVGKLGVQWPLYVPYSVRTATRTGVQLVQVTPLERGSKAASHALAYSDLKRHLRLDMAPKMIPSTGNCRWIFMEECGLPDWQLHVNNDQSFGAFFMLGFDI